MVALGILSGTVGTDINTGVWRFTFNSPSLIDGVSLVALAMGLFGITEVIASISDSASGPKGRITLRSMLPRRDEVRRSVLPILRGTGIGAFFGTLPGTGQNIAAFISYAVAQRVAADQSRFGKGDSEAIGRAAWRERVGQDG